LGQVREGKKSTAVVDRKTGKTSCFPRSQGKGVQRTQTVHINKGQIIIGSKNENGLIAGLVGNN